MLNFFEILRSEITFLMNLYMCGLQKVVPAKSYHHERDLKN